MKERSPLAASSSAQLRALTSKALEADQQASAAKEKAAAAKHKLKAARKAFKAAKKAAKAASKEAKKARCVLQECMRKLVKKKKKGEKIKLSPKARVAGSDGKATRTFPARVSGKRPVISGESAPENQSKT